MFSQSLPKIRPVTLTAWRSTRVPTAANTASAANTAARHMSQCPNPNTYPHKIITTNTTTTSLRSSRRNFSSITRGQDLLADSLAYGPRRKLILDSHHPTGIDVLGMIEYSDPSTTSHEGISPDVNPHILHMNGSTIAFPHMCFLWNVSSPKEVTLESLAMVSLVKPAVEFLFIGSNTPLPPRELNRIRTKLKEDGIVVEQLDLTNAMGTFNILNGEDRSVAVALLVEDVNPSNK